MQTHGNCIITVSPDSHVTVSLSGDITLLHLAEIEKKMLQQLLGLKNERVVWQMAEVNAFDSAAALLILGLQFRLIEAGNRNELSGIRAEHQEIMMLASAHRQTKRPTPQKGMRPLQFLGRETLTYLGAFKVFFDFFGRASFMLLLYLRRPGAVRYKEIIFEIHESAVKALGIVALTSFLIGVVVAYQSAVQLKLYGANIFIVDMIGIAMLRELAPLITAIVVAGRSGSAYAAQIGVMKITEELDAMRTMGFDPYAFLVLPRMIALTLMMPLMIFFSDVMGVLGGMLVANTELSISGELFLDRFREVIDIRHCVVGLVKGPFFALLIATIGIYRGLQVKNDTQSIGFNTTKSVVESIFAVIICDALFSIMFTRLGI